MLKKTEIINRVLILKNSKTLLGILPLFKH
jgi:hypothetical protein